MKAWRRTSTAPSTGVGLLSAPVAIPSGAELMEVSGLHEAQGGIFIEWQLADDPGGPYGASTFDPISSDPQVVGVAGGVDRWFRCRIDAIGPVPITDWSTPVLVVA